jgi:hypothetical protein
MNREIQSKHVETMIASVKDMGIIRPVVCCETNMIEGTKKLYIVDGQHLCTALEAIGETVPYIKIEASSELDLVKKMGHLNSTSKSWVLADYVNAFKMLIPDYMKLLKLRNLYNLEYASLAALGATNAGWDSAKGTVKLKKGEFKITNKDFEKHCKDLSTIYSWLDDVHYQLKKKFLRTLIATEGTYDMKKIEANVKKHKKSLELMGVEDESLKFIRTKIFGMKK